MKKNTQNIKCDTFYHIYNRGINGESLFKQERNYSYFLKQYAKYIAPVAETYAYCLMGNHFHLLVKIKTAEDVFEVFGKDKATPKPPNFYVMNQFAKLFNSYAQSINKAMGRTGSLFEEPFRRIEVNTGQYFKELVSYIHLNPQLHGFVTDYRDYPHSSYHILSEQNISQSKQEEVVRWFGDKFQFEDYHRLYYSEKLKLRAIQEF
jgi:putative transposase